MPGAKFKIKLLLLLGVIVTLVILLASLSWVLRPGKAKKVSLIIEPNRLVASAIGLAIPGDGTSYGYISEHHSFGQVKEVAGDYAEDLAASMLANTLGITFDPNEAWDSRKKIYRMSRKIVVTRNTTQTARGDKNGKWTTVIAAAVFITEDEEEEKPEQEKYLF
jgi:hypothetical protein